MNATASVDRRQRAAHRFRVELYIWLALGFLHISPSSAKRKFQSKEKRTNIFVRIDKGPQWNKWSSLFEGSPRSFIEGCAEPRRPVFLYFRFHTHLRFFFFLVVRHASKIT